MCEDKHDEATIQAIRENVSGLQNISGERLWMELRKILQGNYSQPLTLKMLELGIGPFLGLPLTPNFKEYNSLWDRLKKLKETVHAVTHLAALLHDDTEVIYILQGLFKRFSCSLELGTLEYAGITTPFEIETECF